MQSDNGAYLTVQEQDALISMLMLDEGMSLLPYDDATGKLVKAPKGNITIGIGINIGNRITEDEAIYLCLNRVKDLQERLMQLPFYSSLDSVRKLVLINVAYNVGFDGLLKFKKMLKAFAEKDWGQAVKELLDSSAARKLKGRYYRLADTLSDGKLSTIYMMHAMSKQFEPF